MFFFIIFFSKMNLPQSNVYTANSIHPSSKPLIKLEDETKRPSVFFFVPLHVPFTQEEISDCQGKWPCFTCNRPIPKCIFFYPESVDAQGVFHVERSLGSYPAPHCRPGCAFRTVLDKPNNTNLITYFALMYGPDVYPAPPRILLYIPGGLTIEQYHKQMDDHVVIQEESKTVRSFLCPVYLSLAHLIDHRLPPSSIATCDQMMDSGENGNAPRRKRALGSQVYQLPTAQTRVQQLSGLFETVTL